jgi:lipid II:glycine glycyltransferase (peptidoglycan interpeptide bridge formation enzyme)
MLGSDWQVEVDRTNAAEWSAMLDLFDDANIYQTAAYGSVRWGEKNLSRLVLRRKGEICAIAQLRIVRPTPLKFGMAYLRWGPLWERTGLPVDPEIPVRMARAIEEEYLQKRKLFVRILPNAFIGSARATIMQTAFTRFTPEPLDARNTYRTFVVDLAPSLDNLRKQLDVKWRNQLTRSEKNNLNVSIGTGIPEFRTFCEMYLQMLNRKRFNTTVNVEEFQRMQEDLPEKERMRILIAESGGTPVAGVVASGMGSTAIYLLGATSDAGLTSKGTYLLHWTLIQTLKADGIRWYDLGGIDPEQNPGVFHFKKGFGGLDSTQFSPLVASASTLSTGMVKAGLAVQRTLTGSGGPLSMARSLKQLVTGN